MNGTELAATDLVAGVDVSKARLDTQVEPGAATRSFPNDAAGQRAARDWLRRLGVRRVVLEPTGRYQRALHRCLDEAWLGVATKWWTLEGAAEGSNSVEGGTMVA